MKLPWKYLPDSKSIASSQRQALALSVGVAATVGLLVGLLTTIVASRISQGASPTSLLISIFFALVVGRATVFGGVLAAVVGAWLGIVAGTAFMPQLPIAHHQVTILVLLVSTAVIGRVNALAYPSGASTRHA